jgi:hypothetical protein
VLFWTQRSATTKAMGLSTEWRSAGPTNSCDVLHGGCLCDAETRREKVWSQHFDQEDAEFGCKYTGSLWNYLSAYRGPISATPRSERTRRTLTSITPAGHRATLDVVPISSLINFYNERSIPLSMMCGSHEPSANSRERQADWVCCWVNRLDRNRVTASRSSPLRGTAPDIQ